MSPLLTIFATLAPVGIILIAVLIALESPQWRWLALWVGPALALGSTMVLLKFFSNNGNILAAAIFGLLFVGALVYYPILLIASVITLWRKRSTIST